VHTKIVNISESFIRGYRWKRDKLKKEKVESKGYKLVYIWEDNYNKEGEKVLDDLINNCI